jgi:outer membrane protein OmpA-like peptidoglycan-associated protein
MYFFNTKKAIEKGELQIDPETGEFELMVPEGGDYGVSTSKKGYLFNSINFRLPEFSEYQEIDVSILLDKAEVGTKMVLKNIFFDTGSSDLRTESLGELEVLKNLLMNSPDLRVQINGHTDDVGNSLYNKLLSKKIEV